MSLLMLLLLSTLTLAYLPITAIANPTEIEVLSIYTEPEERAYWAEVLKKFASLPAYADITIKWTPIEMDDVFDAVMRRHTVTMDDPDIFLMHAMWLPKFVDYRDPIVTNKTPTDVTYDVQHNFIPATVAGSSYQGIVYGYPTEFNSWAVVFNHRIFNDTIAGKSGMNPAGKNSQTLIDVRAKLRGEPPYTGPQPISYAELTAAARLLTTRDTTQAGSPINLTGFVPGTMGFGNEEKRFEFMSLLWSNNGEFLDLSGDPALGQRPWGYPEALFNSTQGVEALDLFYNLNEKVVGAGSPLASYNPDIDIGVGWTGWAEEKIAMVIAPTWLTYVRSAMGTRFQTNLGIAPIPYGLGGSASTTKSVIYNWMAAVSQKAETEGRADEAWRFLQWLHEGRTAGYISAPAPIGNIPKTTGVSIMGDWLITDSTLPSRLGDQVDPRLTDFWFKGFMRQANLYGRSDKPFMKSEEVQDRVGVMFERVAGSYSENPRDVGATMGVANETARDVNALLPAPGDINMDGVVGVSDAIIVIRDWNAKPPPDATGNRWYRGRANVIDATPGENWVSGKDGGLIVRNYGVRGDP